MINFSQPLTPVPLGLQASNLVVQHQVSPESVTPAIDSTYRTVVDACRAYRNTEYFGQTLQDKIRLIDQVASAVFQQKEELIRRIVGFGSRSGNLFVGNQFEYVLAPCEVPKINYTPLYDQFGQFVTYQSNSSKELLAVDGWRTAGGRNGIGIFGLYAACLGCTLDEAFTRVAADVKVRLDATDVTQRNPVKGFCHVPFLPFYLASDCQHPLLGRPDEYFQFANEYGQAEYYLCRWGHGDSEVYLFYPEFIEQATGVRINDFAMPEYNSILFNKHHIRGNANASIVIYDDIAKANVGGNDNEKVSTWSGELSFVDKIDWSCVANRKVVFVHDSSSRDSYHIGNKLKKCLSAYGSTVEYGEYGYYSA